MEQVQVPNEIECNICRGVRPVQIGFCCGCGMSWDSDAVRVTAVQLAPPRCVKCRHQGPHELLSHGRWSCRRCSGVFERDHGKVVCLDPLAAVEAGAMDQPDA